MNKATFYERGRPLALYLKVRVTSGAGKQKKRRKGTTYEPTRRMSVMQGT